jgi:predicted Ser/Thr protein kinase
MSIFSLKKLNTVFEINKGGTPLKKYEYLADTIIVYNTYKKNYLEKKKHPNLQFIGKGRSAFVFRIKHTSLALKVFFPKYVHLAREEGDNYHLVNEIPYFPKIYEMGTNYIVMDYIEGITLFDCLAEGIIISKEHITEIDKAIALSKEKGLNPSDIHLKNIILTKEKKIKIIDLARFRQLKKCDQWKDLKMAFYKMYIKRYFPKKISKLFLHIIRLLYKKRFFKVFT